MLPTFLLNNYIEQQRATIKETKLQKSNKDKSKNDNKNKKRTTIK